MEGYIGTSTYFRITYFLWHTSPLIKLTVALCLSTAMLPGSAGGNWVADFQKGFTAYKSDDYATAQREWKPLAEKEDADA